MTGFRDVIDECQLYELELCGGKFTWERSRGSNTWVRERLDRAFGSGSWLSKFPLCKLSVRISPHSDHNPLHLELLQVDISKKKFHFRFENVWLREPGLVAEVTKAW